MCVCVCVYLYLVCSTGTCLFLHYGFDCNVMSSSEVTHMPREQCVIRSLCVGVCVMEVAVVLLLQTHHLLQNWVQNSKAYP